MFFLDKLKQILIYLKKTSVIFPLLEILKKEFLFIIIINNDFQKVLETKLKLVHCKDNAVYQHLLL